MPVVELVYIVCFVLAVGLALGMVILRDPVRQAVCLIGVMVALAGIFVVMHQFFIAAIQIIVYAGAVMALFLWVIMMLNLREPERPPKRLAGVRGWGALLGLVFFAVIGAWIASTGLSQTHGVPAAPPEAPLGQIARWTLIKFLLPVELTSVLLLVGMIGAVTLSRPLRREEK
ncbi:MAG: NADH-quinone oxidoreductase subunit J [Candidatus Sumerlaeia bacterium]